MPTRDVFVSPLRPSENSLFCHLKNSARIIALAVGISAPSLKADVVSYTYDASGALVTAALAASNPASPPNV